MQSKRPYVYEHSHAWVRRSTLMKLVMELNGWGASWLWLREANPL